MQKRAIHKRKLNALDGVKLKPQSRPYLVWDSLQRGLALQVQPSGYRAYKFIYRFGGRPRWLHLGPCDGLGLADARRMAATMMLEVLNGKDPAAERRAGRASVTFGALAVRYQQEYARRRNRSWAEAARLVGRYVIPQWENLDAASISRSDVRTLFNGLSTRAPVLANLILANVSAIFSWSVKQEILSVNPCIGIERNVTRSRERILADSEIAPLWAEFCRVGIAGTALQILLLTGQRPGEVSNMRWEQLTDAGWWSMPGQPDPAIGWRGTKNGQSHRVWLPAKVRELLTELGNEKTGYVFGAPPDLAETMRGIVKRLKVVRTTPHDLRRTHGSCVTSLGFGRHLMDVIQNHRTSTVTDTYDRYAYSKELQVAMETVSLRLVALGEGHAEQTNVIALR